MKHWFTRDIAEKLIAAARDAAYLDPPQAAGGPPDAGPLRLVQVQVCECATHKGICNNFRLAIDGTLTDDVITGADDLMRAVQSAESQTTGEYACS